MLKEVPQIPLKSNAKPIRALIRLDFSDREAKAGGLFRRAKGAQLAAAARERKTALLKNMPAQGVVVLDIDASGEVYSAVHQRTGEEWFYAPVELTVAADRLEDLLQLIVRNEFRTIQMLEPEELVVSRDEMERMLFRVFEEFSRWKSLAEDKLNE